MPSAPLFSMTQHRRACQICRTANPTEKEARLRGPLSLKSLVLKLLVFQP
jgi:hypothetical protein